MKLRHGAIINTAFHDERRFLKESRAILKTNRIRTARLVSRNISTPIAQLPGSANPYKFAVRRRLGGIGDVVMTTVALRGLKEKFPKCHITYATSEYGYGHALFDVLQHNPYIDNLMSCGDFVENRFDYWADVTEIDIIVETSNPVPIERIDIYCSYLGVAPTSKIPYYKVTEEEKTWAKDYLKWTDKIVFLNPASNADRRNVPRDTLTNLVTLLVKDGYKVIIAHHNDILPYEHPSVKRFINGEIRKATALMNEADVVVTHDTGTLHLAGAIKKPIVGLFGNIHPDARASYYEPKKIIWNQDSCEFSPCMYKACDKDFKCMKSISIGQIYKAIGELCGKQN